MSAGIDASPTANAVCDETLAAQWHRLNVRFHKLNCALDRELQATNQISSSEFEVLEQLHAAEHTKLRMSELSELVHLSQSALSRLVSGLEKKGLVERTMCAADRRSVFAALSADGRDKYLSAKVVHRAILRDEVSQALLRAETDPEEIPSLCGADEFVAAARAQQRG